MRYGYTALLAAGLSIAACGKAQTNIDELTVDASSSSASAVTKIATTTKTSTKAANMADISHFFKTDSFCRYLDVKQVAPKDAIKTDKTSDPHGDNNHFTFSKFNSRLFGLEVLGGGTDAYEGGYSSFLIFNNTPSQVIDTLGNIFGHGPEGIPGKVDVFVARGTKKENQDYTAVLGQKREEVRLMNGKSGVACVMVD